MEGQGDLPSVRRTPRDYSLPFKLKVVWEVEKGDLGYKEAQRRYGIEGRTTVLVWLRKHGSVAWQNQTPMKGKPRPDKRIQDLEGQLRRLQKQNEILNKAVDIADKQLGTDIRKKYLDLLSQASGQQADEALPLD